ncbi:unnamed protein product [Adineta steineri]|uniref:U-box domain-containing protein n=1 Tax=Adineta steineri TaxID=433720 RepID=A0A815ZAG5_9BILA|nr:unnamed protein product [Adineta steineri]CAF1580754.1 unnamed protein product [Adineta steineri]
MASNDNNLPDDPMSFEKVTNWARSNREWDKVYQYILFHPNDFFAILPGRRYAIAHQVVYNGNVDMLKSLLVLFSNNPINIHSRTNDGKTLFDIAAERQSKNPAMYTYIHHLYEQDRLIKEAKNKNWRLIMSILTRNKILVNEKPPYSPYFLLHYVVENGDARVLQELLDSFDFQLDLFNSDKETPLDMAKRLQKQDMCSIFQSKIANQSYPHKKQRQPSLEQSSYQPDVSTTESNNSKDDVQRNSRNTNETQSIINSAHDQPQRQARTEKIKHYHTTKSIISVSTSFDSDPPSSPLPTTGSSFSDEQMTPSLICPLSEQQFVDPVIASDGYTYERAAIIDWINTYHSSPTTGEVMSATFRDNTEIKKIIQSKR